MSTDGTNPPTRDSIYPEPHRAEGWSTPVEHIAPPRKAPSSVWIGLLATIIIGAALGLLGYFAGSNSGTDTVSASDVSDSQSMNALQASAGVCLEEIPQGGSAGNVRALPCADPHRAEVVATYEFSGSDFPGTDTVHATMRDYCGEVVQPGFETTSMFQPGDWDAGVRWVAWTPTADSWDDDLKTGMCVVYRDADMIGSFVSGTITFVG